MVLTKDNIIHFLGSTAFLFRVMTRREDALPTADWGSGALFGPDRGLDVALGWPLGLKLAANGLGRNSWLLGFSLAPMWLAIDGIGRLL